MLGNSNRALQLICLIVGLAGVLSLQPQAARASERASDDIQLCDNSTNDPDEGMPACTRIINGSQTSKLETIFNNRANAWFRKKVTIEHVHVHECRQAIVGNVGGGGILTKSEDQPHALGYAPGQTLWSENIPFDNRLRGNTVWGFDRYLTWAVVAVIDPESGMPAFDTDMPRALNCTLYLVMSVWKQGNAHHYPFMTSVKQAGRTHTLPGTAITIRS